MQECPEIDRGTLLSAAVSSSEAPGATIQSDAVTTRATSYSIFNHGDRWYPLHNVQTFIQSGSAQDRLNQIIKSGSNLIDTL